MRRNFYWLLLLFLGLPSPVVANREICGTPPSEQFREENNESIKGDLAGKANFLSGFVGKAELGGKIESTRKEVFAKYSDANAAYMDRYLAYMFCFVLFDPKNTQNSKEKMKAIQEFQRQQKSSPSRHPPPVEPPPLGSRLFFDDFSKVPHQWSVFGSEAKVTDNMFVVIGRPLVVALVGDQAWRNYSVRFKVKLIADNPNPDFGILIAANEGCNFYHVQFLYRDKFASYENNRVILIRSEDKDKQCPQSSSHKLDSKTFRIPQSQWLNIRVDFQGTRITAYVNDSRVISVEDALYSQGKVGLRADETQIWIRDFEVISLANP